MLNHIDVMGRLTRNPELRYTTSQVPVCSFSIACERDFGKEKVTDFIDVVTWRATAEFVEHYFKKGMLVAVSGRLQIRVAQDKNGENKRYAEVVADNVYFCEKKSESREEVKAETTFAEDFEDGEFPF